jgi:hypothetical protein
LLPCASIRSLVERRAFRGGQLLAVLHSLRRVSIHLFRRSTSRLKRDLHPIRAVRALRQMHAAACVGDRQRRRPVGGRQDQAATLATAS